MSRVWPAATYDSECYVLLPVPISTIPIVAGKIGELEQRSAWATDADWEQGYQFALCLQECLMQCGQSFSEVMTLLAVALGANEIAEADLSPAFPALAARLAAARTADTAGVLDKAALTSPPSKITRLSELLAPLVAAGDPGGATPNLFGVLRSAWNFDSIRVTGLNGNELTEIAGASKEIGALLAVLAGLQEQAIADVKQVWPNVGAELEAAQGRELGNGTDLLDQGNAAEGTPSDIIRFSEIARLLQGKFPDTGTLWWYEAGQSVTLYDLYQQQSGLTDEPADPDGVNWIDYVSDLVGIPTDLADLLDAFGLSPGKLKKDGLMIALIAVEFMNLSMTSNLLLNLIGKDKMTQNSPGAPAATHDYLEALLKATRGIGIQRSETDWSDGDAGVGRPPNGTPPPDSLLWALRGVDDNTKAASDTRNVIDTQSSTDLTSVETSLGNIETSLGNIEGHTDALTARDGPSDPITRVGLYDVRADIGATNAFVNTLIGLVNDLLAESSVGGRVNLFDLRAAIEGILNGTATTGTLKDMKDSLAFINTELGWLMGYPYPRADRVDLYDLRDYLICICKATSNYLPLIADRVDDSSPPLGITGGIKAGPATATAPPADICQRARWLVDQLREVLSAICSIHGSQNKVEAIYQSALDIGIPMEYSERLAALANAYLDSGGNQIAIADYVTALTEALVCAIFNANDSANAKLGWDTLMDSAGGDGSPAAALVKHAVWNDLLTALYSEEIPRDGDVSAYSNDCSACGGSGTGAPDSGCVHTTAWLYCNYKDYNGYRYYFSEVGKGAGWNTISRAQTNGWITGDCDTQFDSYLFLQGNLFEFKISVASQFNNNEAADLAAAGGIMFWVDDPQSEADLEAAAATNAFSGDEVEIADITSMVAVVVRYPLPVEYETLLYKPTWRLCAPVV